VKLKIKTNFVLSWEYFLCLKGGLIILGHWMDGPIPKWPREKNSVLEKLLNSCQLWCCSGFWCHVDLSVNPEECHHHPHCCENLKSHIAINYSHELSIPSKYTKGITMTIVTTHSDTIFQTMIGVCNMLRPALNKIWRGPHWTFSHNVNVC
jgi:hypothetical protein